MAEASVKSTPPVRIGGKALRIVLFGMPDAGKSSLLGALLQAAETQEQTLNGHLTDESQGLTELKHRLYHEHGQRTEEEVKVYPITFEPFDMGDTLGSRKVSAVLYDCNGREANQFLSQHKKLLTPGKRSELAWAVLHADTLLLVVDASSGSAAVKRDFAQFRQFLNILEESRSHHTAVSGLPVYLVLTKCDLLASKTDMSPQWMERIEEHKRKVDQWFRESLKKSPSEEESPFGKIDLHVWATAIKRPPLRNREEAPQEPYGIGELFRQCLLSAQNFRQQEQAAQRKLQGIAAALFGIVAVMVLLGLIFWANQGDPSATAVESRIQRYKEEAVEKPGVLYGNPAREIRQLESFQESEKFSAVTPELQKYVKNTIAKLEEYQKYEKKVEKISDPRWKDSVEELKQIEEQLLQLSPPKQYAEEWVNHTEAGRKRERGLDDIRQLRKHIELAKTQIEDLIKRKQKIESEPLSKSAREEKYRSLLRDADSLLYNEANKNQTLPGYSRLTVADVLKFNEVASLYREWLVERKGIEG